MGAPLASVSYPVKQKSLIHLQHQWPRGPANLNLLHCCAAKGGATQLTALLARGGIDIDQGTRDGLTPLMVAAMLGHSHIVMILLNKGADVSVQRDGGFAALDTWP